ncbi:putative cobaltochelatase [Actinokineospora globicatena]|uniref:putative cobaltochelatase n=1 Tax=Actinokineospora globicatena TaxID=103729 RepID=UPI0020A2A112|nr:putative cobaltochelatase [Actinokineospora globicatena]MCP2304890.1 magnesium chelatase subunit D [Actinokineospora globicatena]GLW77729.1 magnesium chelatase [Actinokineospora globicatena]GLW85602.1 magnesium chelatase [Actinokineospora globicatena]
MSRPALPGYPFAAVVGHADLRLSLLLNAVHPGIGGVLVRGEKGTAKSTVVRALAALLPAAEVIAGCRFSCSPAAPDPGCPDGPHTDPESDTRPARLVELPVGATEDRVIGSLDLERALTEGVRAYQPGLLAAAHRGVLYVDEVNLLHDHLVDLLLDAAAMGRAHVEREGVSISHASAFLLVGTMNPEEGELRPQLLDRFGLTVEVRAARDVDTRTEVIRRRLAYEADPAGFAATWSTSDAELATKIVAARKALPEVVLPDPELRRIAAVCAAFDVDGMRADLVVARTSVAHAAWRGAPEVEEIDVEVAARLALPHRRRRDPFDEPGLDQEQLSQALRDAADEADRDPDDTPDGGPDGGGAPEPDDSSGEPSGESPGKQDTEAPQGGDRSQAASRPDEAFRARVLQIDGVGEGAPGRRSRSRASGGRALRAAQNQGTGIHVVGTLTAAAPFQHTRGRSGPGLVVRSGDVRRAVREGRESNLVLFAVDASGSMAARKRMSAVTGAVISLLRDAYQRRDKVGLVTFRGAEAELALPPTSSVEAAVARLRDLRTGGRTPLADGLLRARKTLEIERMRDPRRRALLVVVTDGRATVAVNRGGRSSHDAVGDAVRAAAAIAADGVASVVVDCESGPVRLGLADKLALALGATGLRLEELSADAVAGVVRAARAA